MELSEYKLCPKCQRMRPRTEFWKNNSAKDGLQCYCKDCQSLMISDKRLKRKLYLTDKTVQADSTFNMRINKDLLKRFTEYAKETNVTASEYIRSFIETLLEKEVTNE